MLGGVEPEELSWTERGFYRLRASGVFNSLSARGNFDLRLILVLFVASHHGGIWGRQMQYALIVKVPLTISSSNSSYVLEIHLGISRQTSIHG
jgi:hypothetical protein